MALNPDDRDREAMVELDGKAIETVLAEHWLTRQQAARIMATSAEWVWQLSTRGQIEALNTPLGKLYKRSDVERAARKRIDASSAPARA